MCNPAPHEIAHSSAIPQDLSEDSPHDATSETRNDVPLEAHVTTRRRFLQGCSAIGLASTAQPLAWAAAPQAPAPHARPPVADRRFSSSVIEDTIARVKRRISDPTLATIFENCFPNTLDTTVFTGTLDGKPDTFIITGDIDALWLRDSAAQVWPYLPFARQDPRLAEMIEGVIHRHSRSILIDPYANAFMRHATDAPLSWSLHDDTDMKGGVGERKWEIDSLCYTIRLAHGYWRTTGSTRPFDAEWQQAAWRIVRTFREQQRKASEGPYHFQRAAPSPTDTLALNGYGYPARPVGLIFSMFRPSDDSCIYPLFVPANLFAVVSLHQLAEMANTVLHDTALAQECDAIASEVTVALQRYGHTIHTQHGEIWAYEVDGYGNVLNMDDANAPGLLSLPYLGCCEKQDPLYLRARAFVLSQDNPYFFRGKAAEGIGGPHIGRNYIWPMSIMFRALTSTSDAEIGQCLRWLRDTTAGTNFMHESFQKDDPSNYTRAWFAWANTLFGELVLKIAEERPAILMHLNP